MHLQEMIDNMMKSILPTIICLALFFCACNTTKKSVSSNTTQDLDRLYGLMAGTFSSEEQAQQDSSFYNINLVMHPIWEEEGSAKWLYVEQAVTAYLDQPYRQRVYRVTQMPDGTFASKVYELPQVERFVHAWDSPELFTAITPDSLIEREGCAVYLSKEGDCFTGSTKDQECLSTLRGATYATSIVTVCEDGVVSWDQGWNSEDEQVWGAVKEGYVFKRIE